MKQYLQIFSFRCLAVILAVLALSVEKTEAQSATVSNPLAIGAKNCNGGSTAGYKAFSYDSSTKKLTQINANCTPSLASPGFNPLGGSIAFNPKDQKVYYIETTTGNNSIIWSWLPGSCPTGSAPVQYNLSTFTVGLEFNAYTGDGYFLNFSTGAAPYTMTLTKVTSFSPFVIGAAQTIVMPTGVNVWKQNGDIVITPTGKMYFVADNKFFTLDYSTYGTGTLNAQYIDTLKPGTGNNVIGLSFANGNFVTSVQGSSCSYQQLDITTSTGLINTQPASLAGGVQFTAFDMASMITGIGAAKTLSSVNFISGNAYRLTYDIKVKNYGNVNLSSVQVTDNLASVFGSAFVSASVAAVGTLPAGLTINPFYNGNSITTIFSIGGTMSAYPSDSAIVRVTVNVNNLVPTTTYKNSAIATASGSVFLNNVRDSSINDATLNPDPSGTNVPDVLGQGTPTPFNLATWLILPNKIESFEVANENNRLNFDLSLGSESPANKIFIEESFDGSTFKTLGSINSKGEGSHEYTYTHARPGAQNKAFYRLRVVSSAGESLYSVIKKVVFNNEIEINATVGPNPFNEILTIETQLASQMTVKYKLLDFSSRIQNAGSFQGHVGYNKFEITNLATVTPGIYVLDVYFGNVHKVYKVVKR